MKNGTFVRAVGAVVLLAAMVSAGPTVDARASTRNCGRVRFPGVADFELARIRATGASCKVAVRVVRGARLHQQWHSRGFACKLQGYELEVRSYYRCTKGPRRVITFQTA